MKDSNSDDQGMKVEQEAYRQAEAFLDTNENQQVFPPDHSNEAFKDCVNFKHLVPNSAKGSLSRALADPDSVPSAKKLDDRRLKTMLTFVEGVVKLLAKSNKNKPGTRCMAQEMPAARCGRSVAEPAMQRLNEAAQDDWC